MSIFDKIFKINEEKIYTDVFENMTAGEFWSLSEMPKNVTPEHMQNMSEFLKIEKVFYEDEESFMKMKIGDIIVEHMIREGEANSSAREWRKLDTSNL
jgi:hypothetical protein